MMLDKKSVRKKSLYRGKSLFRGTLFRGTLFRGSTVLQMAFRHAASTVPFLDLRAIARGQKVPL